MMDNSRVILVATVVVVLSLSSAWAQDVVIPEKKAKEQAVMPGMDHSQMNHATPEKGQTSTSSTKAADDSMDHGGGMEEHGSMQGGPAPPDARDPHAYSEGYGFGPIPRPRMGDEENFGSLLVDRLESVHVRDNTSAAYDLQAWFGRDYDRGVLRAEGSIEASKIQDARTELLWGHAVTAYWDTRLGVRYDSGVGLDRGWLAFGIQGLAPYWFDIEATAYARDAGRIALRFAADYELLLTQKLILQSRIETNFYGKRDVKRDLGSGLSELIAGIRIRYEIRRELAPYIGIEWVRNFGETADYTRIAGEDTQKTQFVAGVRFWF